MDTPDNYHSINHKTGSARRQTSSPAFDSSAVFASTSAESSRFFYEYSSSTESIQVVRTPAHLPENGAAATRRVLIKRGQVGADLTSTAGNHPNGETNNREENAEHDTYIKQEEDDSDYYAEHQSHNPVSSSFQFSPSPPPLPPASELPSIHGSQPEKQPIPYARRALLQTARKLTLSDLESSGDEAGSPPKMAVHLEPGEGVSFHNSSGVSGDAEEGERIETPPELSAFDKKNVLGDEQETASGEAEPAEPVEQQHSLRSSEEPSRPVVVQHIDEDAELRPRAARLLYEENFTQEELDQSILSGPKRVIPHPHSHLLDEIHENTTQEDNEQEKQQKSPIQSENQHQKNRYNHQDDREETRQRESSSKLESVNLDLPDDQQHDNLSEPSQDDEESDEDEPLIKGHNNTTLASTETVHDAKELNDDSEERQTREQRREKLRQERLERERERQAEQRLLHTATSTSDQDFERARHDLAERLARERETRERLQREEVERAQRRRETEAREQARLEAEQARIVAENQAIEKRREEQRKRERELDRERQRKKDAELAQAIEAEKARHLMIERPVNEPEPESDEYNMEQQELNKRKESDRAERDAQERASRERADRERIEREERERRFLESHRQSATLLEQQLQRESKLRTETTETEANRLYPEHAHREQQQHEQQRKRIRPSLTRTPLPRSRTTPKKTFSPQSPSQRLLQRRAIYPRIGHMDVNHGNVASPARLQSSSGFTVPASQRMSNISDTTTSFTSTNNRSKNLSSTGTEPDEARDVKRARVELDWTSTHWGRLYRIAVGELCMSPTEMAAAAETAAEAKAVTSIPLQVRTAFPEFDSRELGFRLLALARTLAKNGPRARDLALDVQQQKQKRLRNLRDYEIRKSGPN